MNASVSALLSKGKTSLVLPDGWEVPVVFLDDLDLGEAEFIRGPRKNKNDPRNQRFIYRNTEQGIYIKIWPTEYARAANFSNALKIGFYHRDLCGALTGIVVSDDFQCRGYLMKEGEIIKYAIPESLLRALLLSSMSTHHFYYDLVRCTIKVDGAYSLIDLEGVYQFSQLAPYWRARLIGKRTSGCVASPMSYHRVLCRLLSKASKTTDADCMSKEIERLVRGLAFVAKNK